MGTTAAAGVVALCFAAYALWAARRVHLAQSALGELRGELAQGPSGEQCWCEFLRLEKPDPEGRNHPIGFQIGRQIGELRSRAEHAERQATQLYEHLEDARRSARWD